MAEFYYRGYKGCYNEFPGQKDKRVIIVPDDGMSASDSAGMLNGLLGYHVVTVDFLGCGQADKPWGYVSDLWHDQAMQLKELFYAAEYDSAVLVGIGAGGCRTCEEFLKEAPEKVEYAIMTYRDYVSSALPEELKVKIRVLGKSMRPEQDINYRALGTMCCQILDGVEKRCPYCGGMMRLGTIFGQRGPASWCAGTEQVSSWPDREMGEFYLRNKEPKTLKEKLVKTLLVDHPEKTSYVCYACGILLADISNNVNIE